LLFLNRAVAAGAGVGLLPLFFGPCEEHAQRMGLVRVMPAWHVRGGPIHVVAPGGPHEPRRVRLFREFLLAEAKKRGFSR
jgi:DNA-binding transcriptional LysR family regulator